MRVCSLSGNFVALGYVLFLRAQDSCSVGHVHLHQHSEAKLVGTSGRLLRAYQRKNPLDMNSSLLGKRT